VANRVTKGVRVIGRYALHDEIAAGGMATVHFGRLLGQAGFSRTVAIKRLHAQFAKDPDFVSMFMDEARLAARIHHPNVVSTLDVVARDGELFLVMEYIPGEALSKLARYVGQRAERIDPRIAVAIVAGFLHGLHAAHEARNERGEPLEIVHRDVSPQNVLVGTDGVARVVDFGVAKAVGRVHTTREGQLKGKLAYMAPEQIHGIDVTRRTDVYAASIVLWELLVGKRLFARENEAAVIVAALTADPPAPGTLVSGLPEALDRITLRGLARSPEARFATAREMALALEEAIDLALPSEVGAWVQETAGSPLGARATRVAEIESNPGVETELASDAPPSPPRVARAPSEPGDAKTLMTSATPGEEITPARGKRGLTLSVAVGVASAVAAFALIGRFASPVPAPIAPPQHALASPPPAAAPTALALPPSTGAPAEPPPPAPPADSQVADSPNEPSNGASATPEPSSPPASHPATSTQAGSARAAPARRPPPPPPRCDPPYRVDPSGRKIFKLECL
jgi:serine/threonine protein kinase